MSGFDVDAARAQRLEAHGRQWRFEVGDSEYTLPTELPRRQLKALQALDDNDIDGLLALLLGEEQYARFADEDVTMQDVAAILGAYGSETGMGLGEG
ncbi:hypothetical protein OG948_12280 [Embleya sp. NBC_00888]|uniref:hypothetical protein n=1 Tax=Embleya sp. NBC_00888 TaxID=2975960 RepID=UPI00386BA957|nr:hypothetical protein OG948_12280 [Embleya sp. NBC_00888]